MLTREEMLENPNYLLNTYQLAIHNRLGTYMEENGLKNKDVAKDLKVSESYVSQILNANSNFTLKKLIELGLMMNKVAYFDYIEPAEYWQKQEEAYIKRKNKALHEAQKLESERTFFEQTYKNISTESLAKMHEVESSGGSSFQHTNNKNITSYA